MDSWFRPRFAGPDPPQALSPGKGIIETESSASAAFLPQEYTARTPKAVPSQFSHLTGALARRVAVPVSAGRQEIYRSFVALDKVQV